LEKKQHFYQLNFSNKGGLIMPLIIEFQFEDGTSEIQRIPAEIWRYNNEKISKVFAFDKAVSQVVLDPYLETADVNTENNYFPRQSAPSRFELFKQRGGGARGQSQGENPMQQQRREQQSGSNGSQGGGRQ
jgi:hypothetical protein